MPDDFERMWGDLAPVGRSAASGGYFRQPFTPPEQELRAWFVEQCAARRLRVETDDFGNVVGWWDAGSGPAVLTGSHLDSVLDGGAYDGPLGVVSALAAIDLMRDARRRTGTADRGVGVRRGGGLALRAGLPRLAAGRRVRRPGSTRGRWPTGPGSRSATSSRAAARTLLDSVGTFVELHVEQGRDLVDRGAAVGVASEIWPHGRYRFDFAGAANHAGTTRMEDRQDPMLTYAMTALAANKQARLAGQRATFGRVDVDAQRHQRGAVAGARPGWTPGARPTPDSPSWSTRSRRRRPTAPGGTAPR